MLVLKKTDSLSLVHKFLLPKIGSVIAFEKVTRVNMSSSVETFDVVPPSSGKHTGTVIFLHGSGGTGALMKEWVHLLRRNTSSFPHLKIMYPTAPLQPYIPLGGELSNVWFNRVRVSPDCPELLDSINSMAVQINENIVRKETEAGIPINRIVIGGFSMGGAMALHLGYRYLPELAGIFNLSSFANDDSIIYKKLEEYRTRQKSKNLPVLFHAHGDKDDVVPLSWGQTTFSRITKFDVQSEFHTIPNAFHELRSGELNLLFDWINRIVPDC